MKRSFSPLKLSHGLSHTHRGLFCLKQTGTAFPVTHVSVTNCQHSHGCLIHGEYRIILVFLVYHVFTNELQLCVKLHDHVLSFWIVNHFTHIKHDATAEDIRAKLHNRLSVIQWTD